MGEETPSGALAGRRFRWTPAVVGTDDDLEMVTGHSLISSRVEGAAAGFGRKRAEPL